VTTEHVHAGVLDIAVERSGDPGGWPVVLLHGFPYDVHSYDRFAELMADEGADVVVPYLRGYGAPGSSTPRRCGPASRRPSGTTCSN
jgi:pimeloyl-ACP methyl ester carboxylesterase